MTSTISSAIAFALLGLAVLTTDASGQVRANGCAACHAALPEAALSAPPGAMSGDVHDKAAVSCASCHGGDPAASDRTIAHDPARGYKGTPSGATICASCHALLAEKFAPSVHAPIFERSCVECHGNHGVQPPSEAMLGVTPDAICSVCHTEKDDPGFIAADRMRTRLDGFRQSLDASAALLARARNSGMEVGAQELALAGARTQLTLARTELHAFNPATLDTVVDDGVKLVTAIDAGGNRALQELTFRRRGLFLFLGAILLMIVALALKIRELDRRPR